MFNYGELLIAFAISLVSTLVLTYPVKKLAMRIGAVDYPNHRKIHKIVTPRLGGLAMFIGTVLGVLYLTPYHHDLAAIGLGALIIVITGMLDDKYTIRPVVKLTGQLIAASILISADIVIQKVTLPFFGMVDLGFFSVFLTVLWIVGITNAINLIDGLDGLATGVATIALASMLAMSIIDFRVLAAYLCITLIGSNLGFLYHNFYPAKIYMGDTGSNFLGYMIAVVSILGLFKNIALFSFIIPVIILALPILDTFLAIIRRMRKKENIMMADNKHLHYRLLSAGYSHRQSVLILYAFSAIFGILALLFSEASLITSLLITLVVLAFMHVIAEIAGLVLGGKKPIVDLLTRPFRKKARKNHHED
ncbi:glycosyltransferase family 4 protein [Virgibacillus halophilus]|uniref:MraY family glycosyltransferase n=1 Tax=Tigheibacillus halophilus TaxID=361280 RepID=A0ABU5C4E5_9BACI|nr:MraY family glycosyltransferase [Virgibacillus halophilus]